jgi:hypothetical protein
MIRIVADIQGVYNVPEDLLGQARESVGVFDFLQFDACSWASMSQNQII